MPLRNTRSTDTPVALAAPADAAPETAAAAPAHALSDSAAYLALLTRDARFDGRLFVGVTSTRIYCRPICRVKVPKAANCRFFANAAGAEQAGFRPCLRCRPELAPGLSHADSSQALARAGAKWIEHAVAQGEDLALPDVARRLGVTDRHFRRIFQAVHGVSPVDWLVTRRLLLAKQLLTDTLLPVTEIAGASGFGSVRRFNAAFAERYRLAPSALRRQSAEGVATLPSEPATVKLAWRPPYDVAAMQGFLAARPLPGVEALHEGRWHRTLALTHRGQRCEGWLALAFEPEKAQVRLTLSPGLAPALGAVVARVRHLLDLDADPNAVDGALAAVLAGMPQPYRPGLRVPGCIDGFETTVRIILGQQVTVAAACTLAGRLVQRFGQPLATPVPGLTHLFPTAQALAEATPEAIGTLGIVRTRVAALQALAREVTSGELALHPAAPMADTLARLRALPGVGDWTCELVALRVLAWPDAFPATDAGVVKALQGARAPASLLLAEAWRPWRSYAVLQLWQSLSPAAPNLS
ncbi:MAG TPA: AlkA N-terminal domain-containing protein [Ideonella sp.]|uniref:AlkA N-terminal domain-containing protein n=1 Tax=Ideonella sp. TaxID=1929293 RepID=UPI002B5BF4B1|nr:AlkA N-terminal domain-containing protein [Ideonella sp.]HSI50442.1 AlkA N-terminal domain-containing protein [Ideonella sp.]